MSGPETRLFVYGEFADDDKLGYLFSSRFTLVSAEAETTSKMFYIEHNSSMYLIDPQTASVVFDRNLLVLLRKSEYFTKVKGKVYNIGNYDNLFIFDISFFPRIRAGIDVNMVDVGVKKERIWTYYYIDVRELNKINWEEAIGVTIF